MTELWYLISHMWIGTLFYGIYLVLFCICIYILLHRPRDTGNTVLLVTAIALFTLSTIQTIFNIILGAADVDDIDIPYNQILLADSMIYVANNIIADGLVIWRCYIIWNRNIYIVALPIILLVVTSIFGWDILLPLPPFFELSLATNVLVTSLTGALSSHPEYVVQAALNELLRQPGEFGGSVARHAPTSRQTPRSEVWLAYRSFNLLLMQCRIESGVIYSASVLVYLILGVIPSALVMQDPIVEMLAQVVGIVPTLIIVRVSLGMSVKSIEGTVAAAEALSNDTRPPKKRHILRIGRPIPMEEDMGNYDCEKAAPDPSYHYAKGSEAGSYSYGIGKPQGLATGSGHVVYSVEKSSS
ncbi:hypothetical protein B0H11DRAFT_2204682 [Mycena galericulata]|nr:hypothetical protein B0H11DRAFT_2204682 [Mycena galericulata]